MGQLWMLTGQDELTRLIYNFISINKLAKLFYVLAVEELVF